MKRLMPFLLAIAPFVAMTAAAAEVPRTKIHTNAESSWDSGEYFYDGSGNIRAIGLERYVYDAAGRIVSGTALGPANRQSYTYDAFGNRLSATTVSAFPCAGGVDCQEAIVVNSATNRMEGSATYDEAGNVRSLGNGHSTYEYDPDGMIAKQVDGASVREYVYTADDQRIAVVASQQWLWTVRDPAQRVLRDFSSRDGADAQWTMTQDYIYSDVTLLGTLSAAGRRHLHLDHLGTTRLVTDDASRRLAEHAYYPFGAELQLAAERPEVRMKFTGHERDTIPGEIHTLDYMHARYYAASMGRFLSVDPVLGKPNAPQSWNRYAYVRNNPLLLTDPDGKADLCPGGGSFGGAGATGCFRGPKPSTTSPKPPATTAGSAKTAAGTTQKPNAPAGVPPGQSFIDLVKSKGAEANMARQRMQKGQFDYLAVNVAGVSLVVQRTGFVSLSVPLASQDNMVGPSVHAIPSVSVMVGTYGTSAEPSEAKLNSYITGGSFSVSGGSFLGVGVNQSLTPNTPMAVEVGLTTPGASASWNDTTPGWKP
jgi:RHS repeat-associated protein